MARHPLQLIATIALVAIVLEPLVRNPHDDGFPLSTYPMFASPRPTTLTIPYAVGITQAGVRPLRPSLVGSGEILQALAIVERAVGGGARAQQALCQQIAARVAQRPSFEDVTGVKIVVGTHDAVEYLVRGAPGKVIEKTRCAVMR